MKEYTLYLTNKENNAQNFPCEGEIMQVGDIYHFELSFEDFERLALEKMKIFNRGDSKRLDQMFNERKYQVTQRHFDTSYKGNNLVSKISLIKAVEIE